MIKIGPSGEGGMIIVMRTDDLIQLRGLPGPMMKITESLDEAHE